MSKLTTARSTFFAVTVTRDGRVTLRNVSRVFAARVGGDGVVGVIATVKFVAVAECQFCRVVDTALDSSCRICQGKKHTVYNTYVYFVVVDSCFAPLQTHDAHNKQTKTVCLSF